MPIVYESASKGGGSGTVTSVTAGDTSIVVGGTATDPTVKTNTLDVIAADHPAAADWSNNSHKITGLANGTAVNDAAAFGQIPTDGWITDGNSPTFASSSSFTAGAADLTAVYSPGTRLKLTQTTVKYFVVASSSFGGGTTTVNVTGGSDYSLVNAAITSPFYSYAANPQGYPGWFNYAPTYTGFSVNPTGTIRFAVVGRTATVSFNAFGTSNATTFTFTVPIAQNTTIHSNLTFVGTRNNGTDDNTPGVLDFVGAGSKTVNVFRNISALAFTASGSKGFQGIFSYEI